MKSISGSARLAGVMGWPVRHSLSPRLHGYWLETLGIDGAYVPLAVAPTDVARVIEALGKAGFAGLNVTVPHKETVMRCVETVDALAERIGAVNTIVYDSNGHSHGMNTDGYGFIENIRQHARDHVFTGSPAIILGAGGAARAIVVALIDAGVPEIRLVNRTLERAETMIAQLDARNIVKPIEWDRREDALADAGLLVNTTTLGMKGQPKLDVHLDKLPDTACVTDIVYSPLETPLLAEARTRGNRVVNGIGMLLHQARPGFKAWFGVEPEVTEALRAHVLEAL